MYFERKTLRRIARFLIFGSVITMLGGAALFFFAGHSVEWLGLQGTRLFFVKLSGLLLGLLGVAYTITLLEREPNKGLLILGFFQKLFSAGLIFYASLIHQLPNTFYVVVIFDFRMAVLFLVYMRSFRTDDWL